MFVACSPLWCLASSLVGELPKQPETRHPRYESSVKVLIHGIHASISSMAENLHQYAMICVLTPKEIQGDEGLRGRA